MTFLNEVRCILQIDWLRKDPMPEAEDKDEIKQKRLPFKEPFLLNQSSDLRCFFLPKREKQHQSTKQQHCKACPEIYVPAQ
jgi:hypothetical protein